jgi:hypothetical protein
MRAALKTIAGMREAGKLDEERFKHVTAAHHKILRELQRSVSISRMHKHTVTVNVTEAEKERHMDILRRLTKPQTDAEADRLTDERIRGILRRQGRTQAEVDELLSSVEQGFELITPAQHEVIAAAAPPTRGRVVSSLTSKEKSKE